MKERDLDDWLRRAAAQQRAATERALTELDLTPAQFAVLCVVSERPGISAADVARTERLTAATLSVIVSNLVRKKALERRPHPENARVQQLAVTALGARVCEEGGARLISSWRRLRSTLPPGAETSVLQWLRGVAESGP